MEQNKEYFVFISYSSLDNEWALWLRHELEHYHLPASFNGRADVRDNLRKVFRDRDELSAGPEWDEQVQKALEDTNNLIVICSPHSAKSDAVNKEIETFIALGREDHIFPFIVEGDKPEDCFPPALKHSKLGGDVNKDGGRDSAFIKVVAGMLKVSFPSLWNRYEIEKAEEERKIREQRDNLLRVQSLFLSEKANTLIERGYKRVACLLALEALPNSVMPDRPYVPEAEVALMKSAMTHNYIFNEKARIALFSPNGHLIATEEGNVIHIWDSNSQKLLKTLEGHTSSVLSLAFNHDGSMLASSSKDCSICLWNIESGMKEQVLYGHKNNVNGIVFSQDDEMLASISDDFTIRIWDLRFATMLHVSKQKFAVTCIVESPDGKTFATGTSEGRIRIWEFKSGKELRSLGRLKSEKTFPTSHDEVCLQLVNREISINKGISYSPDGTLIAAASMTGFIYIWQVESGALYREFETGASVAWTVAFSPDGKSLICSTFGKGVITWDIGLSIITNKITNYGNDFISASYSPDGKKILCSGDGVILIEDLSNKVFCSKLKGHTDAVMSVNYSHDGNKVASSSKDGTVRIWDATTDETLLQLEGAKGYIEAAVFSPNDKYVIAFSKTECWIWDIATGKQIFTIEAEKSVFVAADFSSMSDQNVYTICRNGTIFVWDVSSRTPIYTDTFLPPDGKFFEMLSLMQAPEEAKETLRKHYVEGKNIEGACCNLEKWTAVFSTKSGEIILWDMKSKQITQTINCPNGKWGYFTISQNAKLLAAVASPSHMIHLWDLSTGKQTKVIGGDRGGITSVSFSPDASRIASSSYDKSCTIWDVKSGSKLQILSGKHFLHASGNDDDALEIVPGHLRSVTSLSFSPDGRHIISSSTDKSIIKWYSPLLSHLINDVEELYKDNRLTQEERKKYYLD